jgi:hypothetical protein
MGKDAIAQRPSPLDELASVSSEFQSLVWGKEKKKGLEHLRG